MTSVSGKGHTNVRKVALILEDGDGSHLVTATMILSADTRIQKVIVTIISTNPLSLKYYETLVEAVAEATIQGNAKDEED